jgi:hypothetical protein
MTAYENDKKSIIKEMEETLFIEFMDYALNALEYDIDVEDMVAFLNEEDEVYERYGDMIRENIDEFITYRFKGWDLLTTAVENCSRGMDDIAESIMDDMYDVIDNESGSDDLKPSKIIPRWSYEILTDSVCVTDIFVECFEKEGEIKAGVVAFQSLWRGYDCRWKNPFMLLKESVDDR